MPESTSASETATGAAFPHASAPIAAHAVPARKRTASSGEKRGVAYSLEGFVALGLEDFAKDVVFRFEVAVKCADASVGEFGDVLDGRFFEAAVMEELAGGRNNGGAGPCFAPFETAQSGNRRRGHNPSR